MTNRYELRDVKKTSGRLNAVIRRDSLFIIPISASDKPSFSILEGSSGSILTQNMEQIAEEKMFIPLLDPLCWYITAMLMSRKKMTVGIKAFSLM